ncbi:hypothetical protein WDW86_02065 [Bdellovibrionota bacterium FG-2]
MSKLQRSPNLKLKFKLIEVCGTQTNAAYALKIRDELLSGILYGRKTPSAKLTEEICKLLRCKPGEVGL